MSDLQHYFLLGFLFLNGGLSMRGFYRSWHKDANVSCFTWGPLGIFVWADAAVIGFFWVLVSSYVLWVQDWLLFCLLFSVFWSIRALGESIYWFNQQFSTIIRVNPRDYWIFHRLFHHDDVVWFVFQVAMQCVCVAAVVSSLYFGKLWLGTI